MKLASILAPLQARWTSLERRERTLVGTALSVVARRGAKWTSSVACAESAKGGEVVGLRDEQVELPGMQCGETHPVARRGGAANSTL